MMYQDPNSIVAVTVSTITAPYPSTLQQTGAIVSFGGTNLVAPSQAFLTQFADLAPILDTGASGAITAAAWATGVVTLTLSSALPANIITGDVVYLAVSGMTPTTFNGIHPCTVITPESVTYPATTSPGTATIMGKWQLNSVCELNAQVATFFRQGTGVGIWILEFGYQTSVANEVTALENWINASPGQYYGYLLPSYWGTATNIPAVLQLYQQFTYPEAMTYFWTTIAVNAVGLITKTNKCVIQMVEAPGVSAARASATPGQYAEFSIAGMFYWAMKFKATAITRVSPMCFKYVYGVTPYPVPGNGPLLTSFKLDAVNYIQTGAEGGISYTNVFQGVTADGFDYFNWWWTLDWVQINININISNAVINGSNNPTAPLYYNQNGIQSLQGKLAGTMLTANQYGMVNGPIIQTQLDPASLTDAINAGTYGAQCNVNAVPFSTYSILNPNDYGTGEYDGLSTLFIPARGFVHILVTVVATNIVTL
jgi:hypothetical protein